MESEVTCLRAQPCPANARCRAMAGPPNKRARDFRAKLSIESVVGEAAPWNPTHDARQVARS